MKSKALVFVLSMLLLTGMASATTCGATANVLTGGFSCELGGLTFSNFLATQTDATPFIGIIGLGTEIIDSTVYLNFNPNLGADPGTVNDILFFFTVSGGISGVDLTMGATGGGGFINETACKVAFGAGSTACSAGNLLGTISVGPGESDETIWGYLVDPVYIAKDINLDNRDGDTRIGLSDFKQSFHVPEPASLALVSSGILALGALRRRFRG